MATRYSHVRTEDVAGYLREREITLTYDPASGTLHTGTGEAVQAITLAAR